jgi:tetratricopeptide (TPR) repeat protein
MLLARALAVGAFAGCFLVAAQAGAQGKDEARRFFNSGQKAFQAGRYIEAAKAFEEAFRLKPHPAPLINAGDAYEKAGELAKAARIYERVMTLEQSGEQDRSDATDRLAKITPELGRIELGGGASIKVRIDEEEYRGGDRVWVEPGEHVVTLVDVDAAKKRTVDVAKGATASVELASLMPSAAKAEVAPSKDEPDTDEPAGPVDEGPRKKGGIRPPTLIAFGVGALGLGAGVYFGLQVNDAEKKYNDDPNRDDLDRFKKNKLFANIGFGVAAAGAITGTVLLVLDLTRKPKAAALSRPITLDVAPQPGGGVFLGTGRF